MLIKRLSPPTDAILIGAVSTLDEQQNLFFVNLERFALRSCADIDAIAEAVEAKLGGLNRRVYAIVNYDNFSIVPELLDEYSAMVRSLTDRFYSGVPRYTTSGFLRIKLGGALEKRGGGAVGLAQCRRRRRFASRAKQARDCWKSCMNLETRLRGAERLVVARKRPPA